MGQFIRKVLTDEGERYAIFDSVIDQFTSQPSSLDECSEIISDSEVFFEFDLRSESLKQVLLFLDKLEAGESLSIDEAVMLDNFEKFLKATVAPHQYYYAEANGKVVGQWIDELGLRQKYPDSSWREIVGDYAMYPAFQNLALQHKYPSLHEDGPPATEVQNMLAGRYVRKLATVANLIGDNASTPTQVMEAFYKMNLTRKRGE